MFLFFFYYRSLPGYPYEEGVDPVTFHKLRAGTKKTFSPRTAATIIDKNVRASELTRFNGNPFGSHGSASANA